jgi:DNA adenine methylase
MTKPFFRYPGGKSKLLNVILTLLDYDKNLYVEPFVGSGAVFLNLLVNKKFQEYYINDANLGIYAIWYSVKNYPNELCELINDFLPTVESFFEFKDQLNMDAYPPDIVYLAFMKIAIHQMSFSGLGEKAGSPIGGINQGSNYKIDCRWNPKRIVNKIKTIAPLMESVTVSNKNYLDVMDRTAAMYYIDPPYYGKGNKLYSHGFSSDDHHELAAALKTANFSWVLSYDNCQAVLDLYSDFANIKTVDGIHYSINSQSDNFVKELMIRNQTYEL